MNGRVVKVRRDLAGEEADPEEDFSANQVQSGALEDWVNGKLEDTLPADVDTAAAAYSLRKVSEGSLVYTGDYSSDADTISANNVNITVTGNNDGIFGKDNVLKVENDDVAVPQIGTTNSDYESSTSGVVEFEYYVPSDHPIVGNYWHIGTNRTAGGEEIAYSKRGVKIVGGAWTTAKLFYGGLYGGTNKPTTSATGGRRLITILDQEEADGVPQTISCEDGDLYYISSLTIKTYDAKAVRIRRTSDDVEVDVAFDSDSKVSATSAITNIAEQGDEIGSTTATDLNGFLNEVLDDRFSPVTYPDDISAVYRQWTSLTATTTSLVATTGTVDSNAARYCYALPSAITPSDASGLKLRLSGTVAYTASGGGGLVVKLSQDANGGNSYDFVNPTLTGVGTISSNNLKFVNGDSGDFVLEFNGSGSHNLRSIDFLQTAVASGTTSLSLTNLKFEIIEHGATVHTWYDQAGSNNAVQETDTNQPKIAENGALLADGIEFDSDFLQTTSQVLTGTHTGANSMYVVVKQTSADNGYICGSAGSGGAGSRVGQSLFSSNTNDLVVLTDGTDGATDGTLDKISRLEGVEYLISANYSNNNTDTLKKNANDAGYANGTNAYTFSAGSTFSIGTFGNSTVSGNLFAGSMKEIIVYNSDQSDNRFKIESNINNYYGLYNDEYEWDDATNTEWQNDVTDGTTTFTANGKDGFTITATGNNISNFKYAITSPSTASDDYYQVSFNVDDPDGLFTNAQLRLTANGAGATSQTIDNGFNALSLQTGSSFEYMAINSNGGGSSKTATLSDFKISRIARDGFVETWYDQSGSGNDATQVSALKQPYIVEHGGLCKMQSGNAAVKGTRYTGSTIVFLELDNPIAEPTTIFSTYYTNRSFSLLHCGNNVGGAPRLQLNTNGIKPQFSSADDMGITSVDNTKDSLMTLFSAENGGTAVLRKDGTQIDTLTRTEVESRPLAFLFRHQNNNGRRGVFVDSFIVFNSDKTSDFVEIENELKRANNL
jgi:hypothetical protein